MERYTVTGATGEQLAKRILYLAWQASRVMGMGFLADRGHQPEQVVWANACCTERSGECHADYVLGRMMKLYFRFGPDNVSYGGGGGWGSDYQSFCHKYPTFESLVKVAAASLECTAIKAQDEDTSPSRGGHNDR